VIGWTSDTPFAGAAKTGAGGAFDDGVGVGVVLACPFLTNAHSVAPITKKQNPTTNGEYPLWLIISI
jgi:hypothetical protein